MTVIIDAGTLTANESDRTVTGLLVPYGEECRSNLGKFTVGTGAFSIPADPDVAGFNVEHAREDSIGRARQLRETPEGIVATFGIANTPEGDQALADIKSGKRKHLSAEVANVVIKAGKAVGGRLFGGALVQTPAFPSAMLLAAAADTTPEPVEPVQPDDKDGVTETKTVVNADGSSTVTTTTTKTETAADGTVTETKTVSTETIEKPAEQTPVAPTKEEAVGVPNTLQASAKNAAAPQKIGKSAFFSLLAANDRGEVEGKDLQSLSTLAKATGLFALNDVKYDGTGGITTGIQLPEWIGEVWNGNDYAQKYVPLFSHADLTGLSFQGFQWDVKPQGGDWAGNKSDVPSNTPKFKVVKADAQRYAMAHDIARELQDLRVFGDTNFFEMYFNAGIEDYKKWADNKVIAAVKTSAVTLKADNPAGLDIGPAMSALVDGASSLIQKHVTPTFALVGADYYKQIAKTTHNDTLGYLSATLGLRSEDGTLDGFSLVPSSDIAGTDVFVGAGQAITVRELPGAPVRSDALDIARGGIDHGLFGYLGVQVNKPDALVKVTPYTAS